MANEAVIIELIEGGVPVNYTVADANAIVKGALMVLVTGGTDRTAIASSGDNQAFAGIASCSKEALDGVTTIPCYTKGLFDILNSAAGITAGQKVSIKTTNTVAVIVADTDNLFSDVGVQLETTAGATVDVVAVGIYS